MEKDQIREIVDLMLKRVRTQLTEQSISLEITDAAKDYLVSKGYDPLYGARPLRRVIQNLVEDKLAEGLLQGKFKGGENILIDYKDGEITLDSYAVNDSSSVDQVTCA